LSKDSVDHIGERESSSDRAKLIKRTKW